MKTKKLTLAIALTTVVMFMLTTITSQSQIQFEGLYAEGEGIAGWNADGSGPEPAATGHINPLSGDNHLYYGASRDYISQNPDHAGFHLLPGMSGFAGFEQVLADNGFTPEQVKAKFELCTLMDDIEGIDWFVIGNNHCANYYSVEMLFELDGEPMLSGHFNYLNIDRESAIAYWYVLTSFSPIEDVSSGSSSPVQDVAEAFMIDLDSREIKITYEHTVEVVLEGDGREGYYFNVLNGQLAVGYPEIPFKGLNADHEGFAGWDADGTGPEPYGNGHNTQLYYGASLDYDGIDPDPNACLGHFLDGSTGFFNTLI
ncbi:MAG: hypothetical protein IMY70_03580 [Bacteroidetes bacterium]|nr:hypothetical protein [Bacteroidota bacterium]